MTLESQNSHTNQDKHTEKNISPKNINPEGDIRKYRENRYNNQLSNNPIIE